QLIANQSENFDPRPGRVDVLNRPLPAPDGNTKELGFAISLMEDKLYLKVAHYKTRINNADLSSLANINALRATEVWAVQAAAGHLERNGSVGGDGTYFQAGKVYGISSSGGRVTFRPPGPNVGAPYDGRNPNEPLPPGSPRPAYTQAELDTAYQLQIDSSTAYFNNLPSDAFLDAFGINKEQFKIGATTIQTGTIASPIVTGTTISKGMELELVANPIKGLNVSFNVSKTEAFRRDLAKSYIEFVEDRYKAFQGPAGDVRIWTNGDNEVTIDRYHTNGGGGTARSRFAVDVLAPIRKFAALENTNVPEMRPWAANLTVNYAFQGTVSWLKGVNVGGAYRWQDKNVVGYAVGLNDLGLEVDDPNRPYYGSAEGTLDLWAGYYRRNVWRDIDLRLRLGVRNALYSDDLILASVNPDGSPAAYRIPSPRVFNMSVGFEF
ncbi:MAG TPA: hypothetical protein VHN79_08280, partial [Lacunisphaera sp.]|nr:hypothetical protein [Lacunisphaera sp.]